MQHRIKISVRPTFARMMLGKTGQLAPEKTDMGKNRPILD
jgi:hypothetical protein